MAGLAYRIHLDPIGGIAGDMFVAALADAFPALIPGLLAELKKLPAPAGATIDVVAHRDTVLGGRRFHVAAPAAAGPRHGQDAHDHAHGDGGDGAHAHVGYADIRELLHQTPLRSPVREHALGLFAVLAEAEAEVHGIRPDEVAFHEAGAWDSIADFVAAAYLIDAVNAAKWTCAALPLGGGRIRSAHGVLPLPAPATALLMRGMPVVDDGIQGERVTPTGAAILKYLFARNPAPQCAAPMSIAATGNGFGTRTLHGAANVLRCIAFARAEAAAADEEISVASFEIDDQTAEDLALALDRVRQAPGVLEIYQAPVFGKKGRMATQVQILARPEHIDDIAQLCFAETATLGLRLARVSRKVLPRSVVAVGEPKMRVKLAQRPSGRLTAKAELDDLARIAGGKPARDKVRRAAERAAKGMKKA
jgi:uncharacterized protein (TIGR00299 family) protein